MDILLISGILILYIWSPFPVWRIFFKILTSVLVTSVLNFKTKFRLIVYLVCDLIKFPLISLAWHIDKLIYLGYSSKVNLSSPVCIVGQPRSGTTLLHRTLAQNSNFHSPRHCEMKYPSILIWRLLKLFCIESCIYRISYWPNSEYGKLASKLHNHKLGDYEEHGIFLEEMLYHHYFLYRRFPIPKLIEIMTNFEKLSQKEKYKITSAFIHTMIRSQIINNAEDKRLLLKENESVEFYKEIYSRFPSTKYIFIVRDPIDSISSYQQLSRISTKAKIGIDPITIDKWQFENDRFRVDECNRMIDFYYSLPPDNKYLIHYDLFIQHIDTTIINLLKFLGIDLNESYEDYLCNLQIAQSQRNKGYENDKYEISGLKRYASFVCHAITCSNFYNLSQKDVLNEGKHREAY